MIKQSLLTVVLLFSSSVFAGKNTANALYYFTKGACYGSAATAAVVTTPIVMTGTVGSITVIPALGVTAPGTAVAIGAAGKAAAVGFVMGTESLAQKAYNFGMKL